jgi:hypothetical protein
MYSGDYMAHHVICDGCFILVPVIVRLWATLDYYNMDFLYSGSY